MRLVPPGGPGSPNTATIALLNEQATREDSKPDTHHATKAEELVIAHKILQGVSKDNDALVRIFKKFDVAPSVCAAGSGYAEASAS